MAYKKIELVSFLKRLDRIFLENPDLWYEFILPKEKAEEFRIKYKNNYSKIWHEHCSECWATINLKSKICYYDEEKNWLCKKCFEKMQKDKKSVSSVFKL